MFFQAEDGIRYKLVTGVQTCALPISQHAGDQIGRRVRTYASADLVDGMLGHLRLTRRASRIEDLRSTDRFDLSPLLDGEWNGFAVRIENLSARGARIETPNQLVAATTGTLRFLPISLTA